jgi:hypothetical protein
MKKMVYLINVAIPNTPNLEKKYNIKVQNYLPLAEEIKSIWKQNSVTIVPIIISATEVIPKSLHQSIATLHLVLGPPSLLSSRNWVLCRQG